MNVFYLGCKYREKKLFATLTPIFSSKFYFLQKLCQTAQRTMTLPTSAFAPWTTTMVYIPFRQPLVSMMFWP